MTIKVTRKAISNYEHDQLKVPFYRLVYEREQSWFRYDGMATLLKDELFSAGGTSEF